MLCKVGKVSKSARVHHCVWHVLVFCKMVLFCWRCGACQFCLAICQAPASWSQSGASQSVVHGLSLFCIPICQAPAHHGWSGSLLVAAEDFCRVRGWTQRRSKLPRSMHLRFALRNCKDSFRACMSQIDLTSTEEI